MKNKGFTLIELLAVIVILAIIALIATPIILGIINDARDESNKRSIELYASAVENGIISYQLKEGKKPKTIEDINDYIKYEGSKVECKTKQIQDNGTVYLANCTVGGQTVDYEYGKAPACTVVKQDSTKYSVGDEVTCTLSESTDKFYVIEEAPLTTTSLKMLTEKNIDITTYRQSDNAGNQARPNTDYSSSILYTIVEKYVSYLNQVPELQDATGSLLTSSQAENLGCSLYQETCSNAPLWVYSTNYWFISNESNIVNSCVDSDDMSGDFFLCGVRPVITISTSDLSEQ